jgi:hypothetical protein
MIRTNSGGIGVSTSCWLECLLPELQELADFHDLFAEMLIGVPGLRDD